MYRKLYTLNKEIRLVELEPSEFDTDPVSFVLRYTPLADKEGRLKFSALSYCWGSAKDPQTVMIRNGKDSMNILAPVTMSVNRNLYSALKKLRHRQESHLLWIDLLCIKQNDLPERAQQVELMGEIYSSAHRVYVWLGEGTQWAQEDCQKIRCVEQSYKQLLSPSCPYGSPHPTVGDTEPILDDRNHHDMDNSEKPGAERHPFYPSNTHEELWTGEQVAMCHDQVFELPWFDAFGSFRKFGTGCSQPAMALIQRGAVSLFFAANMSSHGAPSSMPTIVWMCIFSTCKTRSCLGSGALYSTLNGNYT